MTKPKYRNHLEIKFSVLKYLSTVDYAIPSKVSRVSNMDFKKALKYLNGLIDSKLVFVETINDGTVKHPAIHDRYSITSQGIICFNHLSSAFRLLG